MVVYPLYTVDAFSSEPFKGNPAAVCLVPYHNDLTSEVMQKMAAEMNISETAYVTPVNENDTFQNGSRFKLRWFTPTVEVELCGHATLATATVIVQSIGNRSEFLHFETLSGTLTVRKGKDGKLIMDFPNGEPILQDLEGFEDLIKVVVGDFPHSDVAFSPKTHKLLIRLDDSVTREEMENLQPLPGQLIQARRDERVRGVILTLKGDGAKNGCLSPSGAPYDFMSRYFGPWVGIPEDPVTGSAHTVLGPYWAKQLGKKELFACQCSKRIGELWLTLRNDNRVDISGSGYILFKILLDISHVFQNKSGIVILFILAHPEPGQFAELIKIAVGDLRYSDVAFCEQGKLLIRLEDITKEQFEKINPSSDLMARASNGIKLQGVLITMKGNGAQNGCLSPSGAPYDFLSRYFAQWVGVYEDPVCGSAHTVTGPYWSKQLGKKELFACQPSKRSGEVWITIRDDNRVELSGYGYVVLQGTVTLP